MDFVLIGLGIIFMITGIIGCVLPFLPGPPLNYIGLLLLHFTGRYQFSTEFLVFWAIITAVVNGLDLVIPVWGTKKFGGSKYGIWGSIKWVTCRFFLFSSFGNNNRAFCRSSNWRIICRQGFRSCTKIGFWFVCRFYCRYSFETNCFRDDDLVFCKRANCRLI